MAKKTLFVSILLLSVTAPSQAQDNNIFSKYVKRFFDNITSPNPRVDAEFISKPDLPWAFSINNSLISPGVDLHGDANISEIPFVDITDPGSDVHAIFDSRLRRSLHKKFGLSAGYGGLRLSTGTEVGARNPGKNTFLSFSQSNPFFGVSFKYTKLSEYMEGSLDIDGLSSSYDYVSDYPATMRNLSGDVYYVFNGRRFSYKAVTGSNVDQIRSAGSMLAIARYVQGDVSVNPNDVQMLALTNGLNRYSTQQISIGGGYSYNIVPFNRSASNTKNGKGYRNLTFNLTAMTMASLYNHINTYYQQSEEKTKKTRFEGRIAPTIVARGGMSFSWDRFGLLASVVYNRFGFSSVNTNVWDGSYRLKDVVKTSATFDDLTANFSLIVRL